MAKQAYLMPGKFPKRCFGCNLKFRFESEVVCEDRFGNGFCQACTEADYREEGMKIHFTLKEEEPCPTPLNIPSS